MAAVILDPATGQMEYVNAGHPPPMVFDQSGSGRLLPSGEYFPLGIRSQQFNCQAAQLDSQHVLAMVTDGVTEQADSDGKMVGLEGLVAKLCDVRKTLGGDAPMQRVADELTAFLDHKQGLQISQDDRTFLLAARS